jgi:AraC-like DNA-binding protein
VVSYAALKSLLHTAREQALATVYSSDSAVSEKSDALDCQFSQLVKRAEMLVLASPEKAPNIPALCRTLSVSERTLRKAFKRAGCLSPCRQLRLLRLTCVRRAMLSGHDERGTVTEFAVSLGFEELGRFAVRYRKAFGESPSATLRHASSS